MKVTLSDLAKHLGISEATVSLALNDRAGISPKTKKKVLETARNMGYTPDFFARGLATQKSKTIGLIVPEIENPFYSKLTQEIEKLVRGSGHNLILGFSDFSLENEAETIQRFVSMRAEGIMVSPLHLFEIEATYRDLVASCQVPILYIGAHYDFPSHYVMTNLMEGSLLLTEHLLAQGYRNIVFLCGPEGIVMTKERELGFRSAYAIRDLSFEQAKLVRCQRFDFEEAYSRSLQILKEGPLPQAIITVNDIMALGVMKAVRENGYKIPDDIAIAGYDDVIFSSVAEVSLTTVRQPVQEMAQLSVDSLVQLISDHSQRALTQIKISPQLIVRRSTKSTQ